MPKEMTMANSPQKPEQSNRQPGNQSGGGQGAQQRSEGLLPAGKAEDGRFDVAEEVNADQQSDAMRRVGKPPKGITSDALPDSWKEKDPPTGGNEVGNG
jgi:hypothetical protein